jgi:hypothetical protein
LPLISFPGVGKGQVRTQDLGDAKPSVGQAILFLILSPSLAAKQFTSHVTDGLAQVLIIV